MPETHLSEAAETARTRIKEKIHMEEIGRWLFDEADPRHWLCPYHEDHHPGSVSAYDEGRRFHCFSCGADGDVIELVMHVKQCDFMMALYLISSQFDGILNEEQFACLADEVHADRRRHPRYHTARIRDTVQDVERQPFYLLDLVYRQFMLGRKLVYPSSDVLTLQHRQYLLRRGISAEVIRDNGYFSMPSAEVLPALIQKLDEKGYSSEILIGVPGFYHDRATGEIRMCEQRGIGIPIHNTEGQIIAIQIRRDGRGGSRYIWYSSRGEGHPERKDGVSSGSPQDVLCSPEDQGRDILITEGHFKADAFRRYGHMSAISVQGIASRRDIGQPLQELVARRHKTCRILIGFDSDMAFNPAVYQQAVKMAEAIEQLCLPAVITYLFWDGRLGKGLDDVLAAHHEKEIHIAERSTFEEVMDSFMKRQIKDREESLRIFKEEVIDRLPQRYLPEENR
jgi:hypothetical protein